MNLPNLAHIKGIFVTGTDTGVGKTWVAAGITAVLRRWGLQAGYFKPVQSGCPEENGNWCPQTRVSPENWLNWMSPWICSPPWPCACPWPPAWPPPGKGQPWTWSGLPRPAGAGPPLQLPGDGGGGGPLRAHPGQRFPGAGHGPLAEAPLIVVARAGLGTINHTVLTVKAAQHAGVPVAGVVINRYPENPSLAEETNPEVIAGQ